MKAEKKTKETQAKSEPIYYFVKNRERAEGMPENERYTIISGEGIVETIDQIQNSDLPRGSRVLVFKNYPQLETLVKEKGYVLLNPSAELSDKIENKISQIEWLGDLAQLLPPHSVSLVKNISWKKKTFILQWGHSHTGEGTFLVNTEKELDEIKKKFPEREARVLEFIKGPTFTANIVVSPKKVLIGNINYQITGLPPFTENPFSTIGNDWSVPHTILTESTLQKFTEIAEKVGAKMQEAGWKGLCGIDVIYDEERDELFLIEINARQPASTTFESQLQMKARELGVPGMTTFEAHLAALTDAKLDSKLVEINDGAQIIQRVTSKEVVVHVAELEAAQYKVTTYPNTKLHTDLLRIQSDRGIMETHNKFNTRGKEIHDIIERE